MCAEGRRPICQDTGIVVVFVEIGMDVRWDAGMGVEDMVNEGVRRAWRHPDNVLRASIVADPAGARRNTGDNTPAVIHARLVPGDTVRVKLAAKGGGSEHKAVFATLNPSDDLVDWVVNSVPSMGAGWCPPGLLGIGIGGSADKAMLLAKEALLAPIDMHELKARGPRTRLEELRIAIYDRVNAQVGSLRDPTGQCWLDGPLRGPSWRAGAWRPDDGARREDPRLPEPCGLAARGGDPELRRHAPCRFRARRQRAREPPDAESHRLA